MDPYKITFETWNKVAQIYEDKFMDLSFYNNSYDRFCQMLPLGNAKVLDIGCGPGNISKYLLGKNPQLEILGIDIAPNMIALAQKNNPQAAFKVMDSRAINGLQSTFDGVVCGFCLPYLNHDDGARFIAHCYAIMNPNACIYLSFVPGDPGQSGFYKGSSGDGTYFYYYLLEDLLAMLKANKFIGIETYNIKYPKNEKESETHIILIARKGL